MKSVLLTGMSGVGKSFVIEHLAALGYRAVDLDGPHWSRAKDGDWIWREGRVRELLDREDENLLFLGGCATNQVKFHSDFDLIILLSAPRDVLVKRVLSRTSNDYGKGQDELEEILHNVDTVEPRLRRIATHEIDTRGPVRFVVARILQLAKGSARSGRA